MWGHGVLCKLRYDKLLSFMEVRLGMCGCYGHTLVCNYVTTVVLNVIILSRLVFITY